MDNFRHRISDHGLGKDLTPHFFSIDHGDDSVHISLTRFSRAESLFSSFINVFICHIFCRCIKVFIIVCHFADTDPDPVICQCFLYCIISLINGIPVCINSSNLQRIHKTDFHCLMQGGRGCCTRDSFFFHHSFDPLSHAFGLFHLIGDLNKTVYFLGCKINGIFIIRITSFF